MAGEVKANDTWLKFLAAAEDQMYAEMNTNMSRYLLANGYSLVLSGTSDPTVCPRCKPGRCDGTTLDCTLDSYYANPANGPRPSAGTAQNPSPYGAWPGYSYPATRYDDYSPPTERFPAPAPKCECGSGSSVRSGAHSHWCPCWVAP